MEEAIHAAFYPKSIAIIGASNNKGKLGGLDMNLLIESGYKGDIYPINPKEEIVQGYKAYSTVLEVPGSIERAVAIVPPNQVYRVVKECAEKGVRIIQIYSSGFGETGEEGRKIEQRIIKLTKQYNMRIIGPNCIGTYCPESGISFTKKGDNVCGNVSFISQSGGISFDVVNKGEVLGIEYSKVISVGNCIDLDHTDFLEYLANDSETKVIGMYLESVKDGKKFLEALKRITPHKPVVILKGGRTFSGSESVASHTGTLAGDYEVWEALFEQTGVISVKSIEDMLTVLQSLQYGTPHSEGKIAFIGNGGGASVLATDSCEELHLKLAKLSEFSVQKLQELGVAHEHRNVNPIDLPAYDLVAQEGRLFAKMIEIFRNDGEVKHIIFHLNLSPLSTYYDLEEVLYKMVQGIGTVLPEEANIFGVLRSNDHPDVEQARYKIAKILNGKGIPVFRTIEQAVMGARLLTGSKGERSAI
jgi:acetyl-CoA synthetase (ADP-forming)